MDETINAAETAVSGTQTQVQKLLEGATPQLMDYGVRAFGVLLLLFIAWLVAGWVSRIVTAALQRAKLDLTLTKFAAKMARWGILLLALLACLSIFGVETTSFAAVLGAGGLAVGLAFQGSLSNFAAGVMLLVFRPFKVGDAINAAGQVGKVDEIELFTTTLDTPDNRRIIIPNGAIFGSVIENISHHATRRVEVKVGVAYAADIDHTREVLKKAALDIPDRLEEPEMAIYLSELGDSSVVWAVRVWVKAEDFWGVKEKLVRSIKLSLDQAGIGIPYPTMDLNVNQTPSS